jgi:hypothetical protein
MRLLRQDNAGAFSVTKDFIQGDTVPPYAILSHTWVEGQEVSLKDLEDGDKDKGKSSYDKLRFCAEQAKHDKLQYFWVDTCCIDQSIKSEVS